MFYTVVSLEIWIAHLFYYFWMKCFQIQIFSVQSAVTVSDRQHSNAWFEYEMLNSELDFCWLIISFDNYQIFYKILIIQFFKKRLYSCNFLNSIILINIFDFCEWCNDCKLIFARSRNWFINHEEYIFWCKVLIFLDYEMSKACICKVSKNRWLDSIINYINI